MDLTREVSDTGGQMQEVNTAKRSHLSTRKMQDNRNGFKTKTHKQILL